MKNQKKCRNLFYIFYFKEGAEKTSKPNLIGVKLALLSQN